MCSDGCKLELTVMIILLYTNTKLLCHIPETKYNVICHLYLDKNEFINLKTHNREWIDKIKEFERRGRGKLRNVNREDLWAWTMGWGCLRGMRQGTAMGKSWDNCTEQQ